MASRPVYYDLYDCGKYDGRYRAAELMVMLGIHRRLKPVGLLPSVSPIRIWGKETL
nr:MAG TPA: hypothetical protein [Caudoviricetes sp.]